MALNDTAKNAKRGVKSSDVAQDNPGKINPSGYRWMTLAVWFVAVLFLGLMGVVGCELFTSYRTPVAVSSTLQNANAAAPLIDSDIIKIGIFPRFSVLETTQAYHPLVTRLGQVLGKPVELVVPPDYHTFWQEAQRGDYALVHYNQYHYLKTHKDAGYEALVCNEELGRRTMAGVIFVRKDSGIEKVADLKGKKIIFGGDKTAMVAYIAPVGILRAHGLLQGSGYEVAFAKNPHAAIIHVGRRIVDAAGAGDVTISAKAVTSEIDVSELKILARSDEFIQLVWAVSPKMRPEERILIQQTMVELKNSEAGKAILKAAKVTDFYPVTDFDFNKVRYMVESAIGEAL
jgi:phosphonate transport system substrate-binding protein